ncbi:MAG: DUF192 domain-containing protein [Anaerolineae bacterium]
MAAWEEVWNETRGERLLERVWRCDSFLCRLRGLTFRRGLARDEGLLLVGKRESRVETAIHMFFVFFPIAAVWLDGEGKVVDARLARPFRPLYVPRRPARDILEGPPELLSRLRAGEYLRFEGPGG